MTGDGDKTPPPGGREGPTRPDFPEDMSDDGGGRGSSFFREVARAVSDAAGRTRDSLRSLTERGAIHLALKKVARERRGTLAALGEMARESLVSGDGSLDAKDPRVAERLKALDRLEEKIGRLEAEAEELKAGADGADADADGDADGDAEEDGETRSD